MKFVLQPSTGRVVVRPVSIEEMEKYEKAAESTSLIMKPDTVKEKPMIGEVIACGYEDSPPFGVLQPYAPGERVLYGKYSGNEVTLNGEQLLILRTEEVFAIVADREEEEAETREALNGEQLLVKRTVVARS